MERINKFLSSAGICSRRMAEKLLQENTIKVDNIIVTDPAYKVSDDNIITINEKIIHKPKKILLWCYYKPVGYLCTNHDPIGRKTIFEQLTKLPKVISIGRLDLNSEGLLLLTNNGEYARKMELPSSRVKRIYEIRVHGNINNINFKTKKIIIKEQIYNIEKIEIIKKGKTNSWLRIELFEGKNREIRKIMEYYGLQVNRLVRIQYGDYTITGLKPGEYKLCQDHYT